MRPSAILPFLTHAITNKENILLVGEPGIGKTDVVKQAAKIANTVLELTHPVIHGPEDYIGFPMIVDGKPQMVPFKDLEILITASVPTVYFLDDLGQAAPATQKALMQLLWERRIGNNKISPYISFIAATNRREDKAGVSGILETVKSRMTIIQFETSYDDWRAWAICNKVPPLLIAFHKFLPNLLFPTFKPTLDMTNSPCPRTVTQIGTWINNGAIDVNRISDISIAAQKKSSTKAINEALKGSEFEIIAGCCGEGYAIEFLSYARVHRDLPDINKILKYPNKASVPPDNRPDILFALISTLVSRTTEENIDNIYHYMNRLPTEFATLYTSDIARISDEFCASDGFAKYVAENGDMLIEKY